MLKKFSIDGKLENVNNMKGFVKVREKINCTFYFLCLFSARLRTRAVYQRKAKPLHQKGREREREERERERDLLS